MDNQATARFNGHARSMSSRRHKWDPRCSPPHDLVRPVRVDPLGERRPTKGQAAGPHWRRTTPGFYVPAHVGDEVPEQRILEQSMRLPEGGAVTGWASCRLLGGNFFDGLATDGLTRLPVPLAVGDLAQLAATLAATVSRDRLDGSEIAWRAGIPCTKVLRALFDAARTAPDVREAVVAIDMMAAAELASILQLTRYLQSRAGWRGVPQVRRALTLASEDSRSPNETRMRLVWELDAGFPRPLVNRPVFDLDGKLIGIADLIDPVAGVVGEYDGADHRAAKRHARDVAREENFRRARLEYFKVTGPDQHDRPLIVQRMQSTRDRALWLPKEECRWTIDPPPGWEGEPSLDEKLQHRAWMNTLYELYEQEGNPHLPNVS